MRNAQAVAAYLCTLGCNVAVIAAGERWQNGQLRVAMEDMIGAGSILSKMHDSLLSPEARAAVTVFKAVEQDLLPSLRDCVSGRELVNRGFTEDVAVAAQLNVSDAVPILTDGAFRSQVGDER